jgi:hypothetical protein
MCREHSSRANAHIARLSAGGNNDGAAGITTVEIRENDVVELTSGAAQQSDFIPPARSMAAGLAIALLATGAIGTLAWCGILAYGTVRLFI